MFWMRATLVCRSGKWVLEEYAEDLRDIGGDLTAKFDRAQEIEAVITIAHDAKLTPEQLGFSFQFSTPFPPEREGPVRVHSLISWGESQVQVRRALKPEPSQKPWLRALKFGSIAKVMMFQ